MIKNNNPIIILYNAPRVSSPVFGNGFPVRELLGVGVDEEVGASLLEELLGSVVVDGSVVPGGSVVDGGGSGTSRIPVKIQRNSIVLFSL